MSEELDLPGMLELSIRQQKQQWPHCMDAQVWAKEWAETIVKHPEVPNDEGAMIGWFANAIMAGYDEACRRQGNRNGELKAVAAKYEDLLFAVSMKYPNETRHETALRYIRAAENQSNGPAQAKDAKP